MIPTTSTILSDNPFFKVKYRSFNTNTQKQNDERNSTDEEIKIKVGDIVTGVAKSSNKKYTGRVTKISDEEVQIIDKNEIIRDLTFDSIKIENDVEIVKTFRDLMGYLPTF